MSIDGYSPFAALHLSDRWITINEGSQALDVAGKLSAKYVAIRDPKYLLGNDINLASIYTMVGETGHKEWEATALLQNIGQREERVTTESAIWKSTTAIILKRVYASSAEHAANLRG